LEKARILVVEDEGLTALAIKTYLTNMGYEVPLMVTTGEDALRKTPEIDPDLVLMDIHLKGKVDGIEAADWIKETLHIPVVYLTAYSDEDTLTRARVTEPFGYILKPLDERSISAAIEMSLYKSTMQNRLRRIKEQLEAILRCVSDGIVVADMKGIVDYINPAAQHLLGYGEGVPISTSIFRILRLHERGTHAAVRLPLEQVVLEGENLSMSDYQLETSDGRSITVDLDLAPFWDEKGTSRGIVIAFRDVSQRHTLQDLAEPLT